MKTLTEDDFSCWGNGDKYDDELFISHDPKITAVEIADEILKNQKISELIMKNKEIIIGCLKQSDANFVYNVPDELIEELQKILGENNE